MSDTINPRLQRLTPELLKICDDLITDFLIDHVYYWTTIRKNHDTYAPLDNVNSEEITAIIQDAIQPTHRRERVSKAVSDITRLISLQGFWGNLNADEQRYFQRHLRMYINIYMTDCPFEVSSTNRYTFGMHEATITAREAIKKGTAIKYLCGTRVRLTLEENAKHFSIIQENGKDTSLFLGPARFINGECNPNAILQRLGHTGMEVRAIRDIQVGEEITVSYGDQYFNNEDSDYDCRCKTCVENPHSGFTDIESFTKTGQEPSTESSTAYPVRYNTRSKLKRPCETSPENSKINSLSTAQKKARLAAQLSSDDITGSLIGHPACRICYAQTPRGETMECPNCRRNLKIYGYQWPRRRGSPYRDPRPQVAAKDNQVYCTDTTIQGPESDTGSQHGLGRGHDAFADDYFPTLEDLLSLTSRQRDLIKDPRKSQHTIQKGNQRLFQRSIKSNHMAQTTCVNFGDSYEKPIVIN